MSRPFLFGKYIGLFVILIFSGIPKMFAQVGYSLSTFQAAYSNIALSADFVSIPAGGSGFTTGGGSASLDDGTAYITLPFSFNYNGTNYPAGSFIGICTNGFIYFSTTNSTNSKISIFDNTRLYTAVAPNNCIAPWFDDLSAGAVGANPQGVIGYRVFNQNTTNEDTLIIQYQNVSSSFTTVSGQPKQLNFQVWLYKNSGVFEFRYGAAMGSNYNLNNESACIGIENANGGDGNYLDAITGSKEIGNAMINSENFPTYHMRFTPGAPAPIAAGTYMVGVGQQYPSLSRAIADINHRGISGMVNFLLTDTVYDETASGGLNTFPLVLGNIQGTSVSAQVNIYANNRATIRNAGAYATNSILNAGSIAGFINTFNEPLIALVGSDYVNFDNVALAVMPGSEFIERGLWINNSSETNGATNNTFKNFNIRLNKDNTNPTYAVIMTSRYLQITQNSGANSGNSFLNFNISNCNFPITLTGTQEYPDAGTVVGTTNCLLYNQIGSDEINDIGNLDLDLYGIKASAEQGLKIYNTIIQNITCPGENSVEGICLSNSANSTVTLGNTDIYNNKIRNLRVSNSLGLSVSGISIDLTANSTSRIYNNFISSLHNSSVNLTGRMVMGIYTQPSKISQNTVHYIEHNSINIAPDTVQCSNACIELGTKNTITHYVRNNILSNKTTGQQGGAVHLYYYSPGSGSLGAGVFNNNNLWMSDTTNGFFGQLLTTMVKTKATWESLIPNAGPEQNSLQLDPNFSIIPNDLHAANSTLKGAGAVPSSWITTDIDCNNRNASFDLGASNIDNCANTPEAGSAAATSNNPCTGTKLTFELTGSSYGTGINYQWQFSATGASNSFANIANANNITYVINSVTSGGYYRCLVFCQGSGTYDSTNVISITTRTSPNVGAIPSYSTICQPLATQKGLAATGALSYKWQPATGLNSTLSSIAFASPQTTTTYTVTGTSANGCTRSAISTVLVGRKIHLNDAVATPQAVCLNQSSALTLTAGTTDSYTIQNIPFIRYDGGATAGSISFPLNDNDDYKQINLPKNFVFDYFGVAWNNLYVQTNGYISFGGGYTNRFAQTLPLTGKPNNFICLFQNDIVLNTGHIDTFSVGNFPYRKFVISYDSVKIFSTGSASGLLVGQIVLYETLNTIELHIQKIDNGNVNSRLITVGIEDGTGTKAVVPSGRNNAVFEINVPESYRFVPSGGNVTYTWQPLNGLSTISQNNATTNSLANNTTYTVTVTESGGCTTQKLYAIGVSKIDADIAIAPGIICAGQNLTLNGIATAGITPYNYLWSNGITSASLSTLASNGNISLTVTDAAGCSSSELEVITAIIPENISIETNNPVCEGTELVMNASGGVSFAWTAPDNSAYNVNPLVIQECSALDNGNYMLIVQDANGCSQVLTKDIQTLSNSTPVAQSNSPVTSGATLELYSTVAQSYYWTGPQGFASTLQNPQLPNATGSMSGTYIVTVTHENGCTSSSSIQVSIGSARMLGESNKPAIQAVIFPNPANNYFEINSTIEITEITLTDNLGKMIFSIDSPSRQEIINIQNIAAGSYLVKIASKENVSWHKLEIIR